MHLSKKTFAAFYSYVRKNDLHDHGKLSQIRSDLAMEVWAQTGDKFEIFQDRDDIHWGQAWNECIEKALDDCTFLICIITPSFLKSEACRSEIERFLHHEKELGRNDLIFPLLYIDTPALSDKDDLVAIAISEHQCADWTDIRYGSLSSAKAKKRLGNLAKQIRNAIERTIASNNLSESLSNIPNSIVTENLIANTQELLSAYNNLFTKAVSHNSAILATAQHNEHVRVAGMVVSSHVYKAEANKTMASVKIEDMVGNIELVIFPKVWNKVSALCENGKIVIVDGKVDASIEPLKVVVDNIRTDVTYYSIEKNIFIHSHLSLPIASLPIIELANDGLPPHLLTVFMQSSSDPERDRRRIKHIYGILISHHGQDRFQFQIFENGRGHLIDFPNDTTRIAPEMLDRLKKLVGGESWRIEEITFDRDDKTMWESYKTVWKP